MWLQGSTVAFQAFTTFLPAVLSSSLAQPETVDLSIDVQTEWENAPRIDLICRTYSLGAKIMWNVFLPSYLLFWPLQAWRSSGLVVILDDDSVEDHVTGTIIKNLQLAKPIRVKYETKPPENTTCEDWRREGYSRQQYSSFYADLYTDAEYAAIVDSDAIFTAPVLISDLFHKGKPRVRGFDQVSRFTGDLPKQAIGGVDDVGAFMTLYSFPFVVKTSHMAQMREDIARNMGKPTFEEAFHMMCNGSNRKYSQFDIIFNYLWYNKRDEYFWNIARVENGSFSTIVTKKTIPSFGEPAKLANLPTIFIMKHTEKRGSGFVDKHLYDLLCVGSNFEAGDCSNGDHPRAYSTTEELCTGYWSVGKFTWNNTLQDHIERTRRDSSTFVWHRDLKDDKVVVGV